MPDLAMAEPRLDQPNIEAALDEREAAAMAQAMRMDFEIPEAGIGSDARERLAKAGGRHWRPPLVAEHIPRAVAPITPELAQRANLVGLQRVRIALATFEAPYHDPGSIKVDVAPAQPDQFRDAHTVPEADEDHGGVPLSVAPALSRCPDQLVDLVAVQMLARSNLGIVRLPRRSRCRFRPAAIMDEA